MDIEALIDGKDKPAVEPEPVAALEPEPAIVEEPQAPEPTPEPAPEPETKEEGKTIPLAVGLEWRDEAKEYKRRLAEAEARIAPPPEPAQMPDPTDDPQGYASWLDGRVQQAEVATRFQTSDLIAKQQHGAEVVEAAGAWAMERAKTDPVFAQAYMREAHPIDWIVRQHKRDELLKQVGEDPDDFVRRKAAEMGWTAPNTAAPTPVAVAAQQAPKPASPPPSLASAPSKGGAIKDIPTGALSALEAVFPR